MFSTNKILERNAKEQLRNLILAITNVDIIDINKLIDIFHLVHYSKNSIIINEGEIASNFYFIYKGIIKIYYHKNDRTVIERFEKEDGFIGGNFTHLTQKPGTHIYETLEDSILLKVNYQELNELCKKSHRVEHIYRVMMELFHANYVARLTTLKAAVSEERYHNFMEEYGDIANRVSLKDIANYLDMTSETISRIRAKQNKSKNN